MSSYRKHSKNRNFDVCSIDAETLTITARTRVTACTPAEALKGFLAFRATPACRPLVIPVDKS